MTPVWLNLQGGVTRFSVPVSNHQGEQDTKARPTLIEGSHDYISGIARESDADVSWTRFTWPRSFGEGR